MRINQALVAELESAGTSVGSQIYPAPLPDKATLPAVTYQRISDIPRYAFGEGDIGFNVSRFQLDIWATTKAAVEELAGQIKSHLSGFSGVMGGGSGVSVGYVFYINALDDFAPESGRYRIIQEYMIQHGG